MMQCLTIQDVSFWRQTQPKLPALELLLPLLALAVFSLAELAVELAKP